MRFGMGVVIQARLIGLISLPINISSMMFTNKHCPVTNWQLTGALSELTVLIDVLLLFCLAKYISSGINRVCENVVNRCVGRRFPTDLVVSLQGKPQSFAAKPQPY